MDIQQLKLLKILVIGDYCIDIFKYGSCKRLSPEAPVPVFSFEKEIKTLGMAGNVLLNLISLGVNAEIIHSTEDIITKERYVDQRSKHHLLRVDYENKVSPIKIDKKKLKNYDAIIVSDYCKGAINPDNFYEIKSNFSGPIFVDSKNPNLLAYTATSNNVFVKINEEEWNVAKTLPDKDYLIITLGNKGAKYKDKIYPTKQVDVFDVSGAGDTFIAALTSAYCLTKNMKKSIIFANICAANVVAKSGTATVNLEEIKNDLCF